MGNPAVNEQPGSYVSAVAPVTLVDSCVLMDVLADDPVWADWSLDQLAVSYTHLTLPTNREV